MADPQGTADALTGGGAAGVIARAPQSAHLVHAAFADGLRDTFLVSGVLGLLGGVAVLLLVRTPAAPAAPAGVPAQATARETAQL